MATVIPTDAELAQLEAPQILDLWKAAMEDGLGLGAELAPEVIDPNGTAAKELKRSIQDELDRRKSLKPAKGFDRAAFNASIQVARDTGVICRIMAPKTKNADGTEKKIVTLDLFQKVRQLTKTHPSCPASPLGAGVFCP